MFQLKENQSRLCNTSHLTWNFDKFSSVENGTSLRKAGLGLLLGKQELYSEFWSNLSHFKMNMVKKPAASCTESFRQFDLTLTGNFLRRNSIAHLSQLFNVYIVLSIAARSTNDYEWNSCAANDDRMYLSRMFEPFIAVIFYFNGTLELKNVVLSSVDPDPGASWAAKGIRIAAEHEITASGLIASIFIQDSSNLALAYSAEVLAYHKGESDSSAAVELSQEHEYPMELKFSNRRAGPSSPQNFQAITSHVVPGRSFHFTLEWSCPRVWNGAPDSYKLVCLMHDPLIKLNECALCLKNNFSGKECTDCWDTMTSEQSVTLQKILPWTVFDYTFALQTKFPAAKNGSLIGQFVGETENSFIPFIFRHNWYHSFALNGTISESAWSEFMKKSIMLPGLENVYPSPLSHKEVGNLKPICRVQGVLKTGIVGTWSKPVIIDLSRSQSSPKLITSLLKSGSMNQTLMIDVHSSFALGIDNSFSNAVSTTWTNPSVRSLADVSQNGIVTIREISYNLTSDTKARVGCYHWMLAAWYVFIKKEDDKFKIFKHDGPTGEISFDELTNWIDTGLVSRNKPYQLRCAQLHGLLVWSEVTEKGKYKLFSARLKSTSGLPLEEQIEQSEYCNCTPYGLSSPSFDILYCQDCKEMELSVFTLCGETICKSSLLHFSKSTIFHSSPELVRNYVTSFAIHNETVIYIDINSSALQVSHEGGTKKIQKLSVGVKKPAYWTLVNTPGLKSHVVSKKELSNQFGFSLSGLLIVRDLSSLPRPPHKCIFPNVSVDELQMVTLLTVLIKMRASWSTEPKCAGLARPPIVFHVKYALIPDSHWGSHLSETCSNMLKLTFSSRSTTRSNKTEQTLEIGGLRNNGSYCFKVSVQPVLNDTVRILWYSGVLNKRVSIGKWMQFFVPNPWTPVLAAVIPAITVFILCVILMGILVWMFNRKFFMYRYLQRLSSKQIHLDTMLGKGHFGEVWKATLCDHGRYSLFSKRRIGNETVAIKILKESANVHDQKEFREEALLLSKLSSPNIIKFIGICMQTRPMMIALEFMNGGALNDYLHQLQGKDLLGPLELFSIAMDALNGCVYLEAEGFIHCDLSARNCLVQLQQDSLLPQIVKLSDFGLAKDTGADGLYQSKDMTLKPLPAAWSAPEAFAGRFTTKSDVWSFGVLLWEIYSWASSPFGLCSQSPSVHTCRLGELLPNEIEFAICVGHKTLLDYRDPCNAIFSLSMKQIMKICWAEDLEMRPSFKQLKNFLNGAGKDICRVSYQRFSSNSATGSGVISNPAYDPNSPLDEDHYNPASVASGRQSTITDNDGIIIAQPMSQYRDLRMTDSYLQRGNSTSEENAPLV